MHFLIVQVIDHRPYSRKVDVYSFGIVLWEICTCQSPFEGYPFVKLVHDIVAEVSQERLMSVTMAMRMTAVFFNLAVEVCRLFNQAYTRPHNVFSVWLGQLVCPMQLAQCHSYSDGQCLIVTVRANNVVARCCVIE